MGALRRTVALGAVLAVGIGAIGACSDDDGGSLEAFCAQIPRAPSLATVVSGAFDADPTELGSRLERADTAYGELRSAAPAEISDEVDIVVDLVDALLAAMAEHGEDPETVATEVRTAVTEHPDAEAAARAVADYTQRECGIELNPTVDGQTVGPDADRTDESGSADDGSMGGTGEVIPDGPDSAD